MQSHSPDQEFERFLGRRWTALLRCAVLMTGDRQHAEDVVVTALVPMDHAWDRISSTESPTAYTRAAVLTEAMSRRRRARIAATLEQLPVDPPAEPTIFADEMTTVEEELLRERRHRLTRALLTLSPRPRAVLVLRHLEELTDLETATVLDCAPVIVRREETGAIIEVAAALRPLFEVEGRPTPDDETMVRTVIVDTAGNVEDWSREPARQVAVAARARRRRRTLIGSGVAAALVAAVAIPAATGAFVRSPTPTRTPTAAGTDWLNPTTWPVRGSRATDAPFVAEVESGGFQRHVLYAGLVQERTVVVVWDPSTEVVDLMTGPAGADGLTGLTAVASTGWSKPRRGLALEVSDRTTGTLVVLSVPDVRSVELSTGAQIRADGTVDRTFRDQALAQGMATLTVQQPTPDLTRLRFSAAGDPLPLLPATLDHLQLPAVCISCGADDLAQSYAAVTTISLAARLGVDATAVDTTIVYAGPADERASSDILGGDTGGGAVRTLVVLLSRLPSGAVVRSADLSIVDSSGGATSLTELEQAVPLRADTALARPFLLLGGVFSPGSVAQVFAPGAAAVQLLDTSGGSASTGRLRLVKGSVMIPTPADLHNIDILTFDGSGTQTGRFPAEGLGWLDSVFNGF